MPSPSRARGFTLIELGVVLAILCILAAVVAPSFIDLAKTRMAEKAAADVAEIIEASKGFYIESGNEPLDLRWPGGWERPNKTHTPCSVAHATNTAEDDLLGLKEGGKSYLRPQALINPWGRAYVISRSPSQQLVPSGPLSCQLVVETLVPQEVGEALAALLPAGRCVPTDAAGIVSCQASVPPPGVQASLRVRGEDLAAVP